MRYIMSAIAAITINDGTTDHVLTPVQSVPPIYKNIADTAVPLVGQEEVTLEVIKAKGNGAHRVRVTTKVPVMETTDGAAASGFVAAPAVAFTTTAVTDIYISPRSSADQRKIIRNLHRNLLNNAQVIDAIENLISPY
jgi:hypothetical protein